MAAQEIDMAIVFSKLLKCRLNNLDANPSNFNDGGVVYRIHALSITAVKPCQKLLPFILHEVTLLHNYQRPLANQD